jgi:hypothetical protein
MSEFVFLYRGEGDMRKLSPQEAQQSMQQWMAWFKELEKKGKLKSIGQPLERAGKVVGGKTKPVTDGPYAETKDIIGGYSLIEARNLDEAAELAAGCPGIQRGGLVEVRPVMPLNM